MIYSRVDIEIVRGDTFESELFESLDDNDNPIDLSAYSFRLHVRKNPKAKQILIEANQDSFYLKKGTDGVVDNLLCIKMLPEKTSVLSGKWYYDLEIISPDGFVQTPMHGIFTIIQDVTRES